MKSLFRKSKDPLRILPPKAMEQILGYLRGKDLLELSLVSKSWFKFIGNSTVCMDKIKIHISDYFWSNKRVLKYDDVLKAFSSGRKYRHLSIACIDKFSVKMTRFSAEHKLLMALFQWKSILLCSHIFENEIEFLNFLGLMEPFVEEIELRTIKIREIVGAAFPNFQFPHLKCLRLVNVKSFVYVRPFANVSNLIEFAVSTQPLIPSHLDHSEAILERTSGIKQILLSNPNVKHLELFLEQQDFDCMFRYGCFVNKIGFRLKSLMVGSFKKFPMSKENFFPMLNFEIFLRTQSQSLRQMYLPACLGDGVVEIIINEMSNLVSLEMYQTDPNFRNDPSFANTKLQENRSITRLEIWTKSLKLTEVATTLLPVLPNLERVTTRIIDQNILNLMVERNQRLEFIETDFFTATTPPSAFALERLQQFNIYIHSNEFFNELVEAKEKLSNFENAYLTSAKMLKRKWDLKNKSFSGR